MATTKLKDPSEVTVEEKLKNLYQLQTMLSEIDKIKTLRGELEGYSKDLLAKPHIVLCNKIDEDGAAERAQKVAAEVKALEPDTQVFNVSVILHEGLNDVRLAILGIMRALETAGADTAVSGKAEKSSFLQSRSVDDTMEVQFPGQEQ